MSPQQPTLDELLEQKNSLLTQHLAIKQDVIRNQSQFDCQALEIQQKELQQEKYERLVAQGKKKLAELAQSSNDVGIKIGQFPKVDS